MNPAARIQTRGRLDDPRQKRELNRRIFSVVAPRYDTITRLLSFHRDQAWKRHMVDALPALPAPVCLDLACGTGDITFRLAAKYPAARIIGIDLSDAMLARARARAADARITFVRGDMEHTGREAASADLVTGGYALRNAGSLHAALAEVHRVLKPGGIACFLDFSKPAGRRLQHVELLLLRTWGGCWGWLFHRDPGVYAYIAASLARFPDRRQLAALCRAQGFEVHAATLFFGGIVQCLTLRQPGTTT